MDPDLDDTIIGQNPVGRLPRGARFGAADPLDAALADTVVLSRIPARSPQPPPLGSPDSASTRPRYRFRILGDETVYDLSVPAFIGRRPTAPRIYDAAPPQLIVVPSPSKQVSSTHIQLSLDGRSIVVTDLRSTNGTIVTVPGSRPRKLRQGESMVLTSGAVVNIGDGNSIEVLP
ncbi:MAG: FHA domain-containing protein [Microbacteriaceae bacterium]